MSATKNINAEKIKGNLNITSISATTISGTTLYGDGSNLTGISNTFVTGTTFNSNQATVTRNDGVDVLFLTGGTNVNLSNPSTNQIKIDVSLPSTMNTFTTGFTYNDANTLTISRNDGVDLSTSINIMTGLTVNGDITVTETSNLNVVTATTIDFDINYTGSSAEGRLSWNGDDGTLDLGMGGGNVTQQIGQEIYYRVKNQSGTTISNGRVIRNAGAVGASGRILGEYMIADGTYPFAKTLGIATEDIANGDDGFVTEFGVVRGIDTTGSLYGESWSDGDVLYVSPTIPGGLTAVEPNAPNQVLEMGVVLNADINGSIFVDRHLSTKLGDISDVQTTGATNGDLIIYNSATTVWEYSKVLTGDYDINGDLDVTGDTTLGPLTATSITSNSAINVFNGHINIRDNSYFLQGRTVADVNVSLIGVDNQDRVFVGNAGYDTYIDSDTIVDGVLSAQTAFLTTTPTLNNSATDILVRNSSTGEVEYRPVSGITPDTDTFVSGGTYNDTTNNINFSGNSAETTFDVDLTSLVSSVSANTFVIDGTYVDSTDTLALLRNDGNFVNITGITDTFTTGATYDNGTALATFNRNDGNSYTLDLSTIDVNDTFSTGGTVTQSSSNNENNQTIQIVGNDGFTPYNITNITDTFTTGGTYNNGTALITFDRNNGTTYDVDLSTLDLNDTFVTGTTFSSNQATVTRNDGTDVLLLTGGTNVTLSNPSTNQIKIDVTSSLNITTVSTTTYTATTSDEIIGVDTSSNAVTITLPDSLSSGTLRYEIKDIGFNSRSNPITIQAVGSDSIRTTSLVSSFTLSADGGAVVLINTATREWWQM